MPITFVNSTAGIITAANQSTWSLATHSSRLGGAAFMVGLGLGSSAVTVSAVTDNTTNTYLLAIRRPTPKPAVGTELWYVTNISSASTRVSVTLSGNSSGGLAIAQFAGVSTANSLLATASSAITANSTSHGAAEITSSGTAVSFSRLTASTLGTITGLGSMTAWVSTNALLRTYGQYLINTAPSTVTASYTTSSNAQHASVLAVFSDTVVIVPGGRADPFMLMGMC